jgi:hypothetical protein
MGVTAPLGRQLFGLASGYPDYGMYRVPSLQQATADGHCGLLKGALKAIYRYYLFSLTRRVLTFTVIAIGTTAVTPIVAVGASIFKIARMVFTMVFTFHTTGTSVTFFISLNGNSLLPHSHSGDYYHFFIFIYTF